MTLDNREVDVRTIQISGVDRVDYPDFVDAYFYTASFLDNGEELDDDQLDRLTGDHPDFISEYIIENALWA